MMMLSRRQTLLGLGAAVSFGGSSLALAAAPGERRFVVVILRGAMDGLAAAVPYGDPALAALRGPLVPPAPGQDGGLIDLGGFYGLHPALAGMGAMYHAGDLLVAHAVAGHYRTRSHFEGQDLLESGSDHRMTSGWLNRVVGVMPAQGLSVGVEVPLLLRGPAPVGSWAPHGGGLPQPDLYARLVSLNAADPLLGPALATGLRERGFAETQLAGMAGGGGNRSAFPALASAAGRLMAAPDGPRIAALEIGGWDTHAGQAGRMVPPLKALDEGLVALRDGLGDTAWKQTVVLTMTEFGRTARVNGTNGTDHGTGTVAFVAGGAVAGGRVLADWPGLGAGRLFEDRDLMPTMDLRGLAKGLLAGHLGLGGAALARVFPGGDGVAGVGGLVRA